MKRLISAILFVFASAPALAFMTVQESNEITAPDKFKLGVEPQFRISNGNGFNFSGFFDTGINDELSARALVGSGDTDFVVGGSLKWVPIPDYGNQPSLGAKIGGYYWREANENYFTARIEPILSKKFKADTVTFIPYGSIPVMFNSGENFNKTTMQLALGSEFLHDRADNMTFGAEVGFDAKDSFSYISGYVTIYLENESPTQIRTK